MRKITDLRKMFTCLACIAMVTSVISLPQVQAKQTTAYQGKYMNTLDMMKEKASSDDVFPVENVALGKTVDVSGLEVEGKWTGGLMVDGDKDNVDSRWSSGIMRPDMTPSSQQTPQWAIIDLQAPSTQVSEISIYYHLLVWGTDYEIQTASRKDGQWETLETITKSDSKERNPVDKITKPLEAKRYIRLYFRRMNTEALGNALSIKEIEINGKQIIEGNLALQKPVKVSSLEVEGQWTGDLAVDGNYEDHNSRWSSGLMRIHNEANAEQAPQWLTIDLKTEVSLIEAIDIRYFQLVWGTDYEIQTAPKLDGEWRTLETIKKDDGDTRNPVDTIENTLIVDRYIRFYYNRMNTNAAGKALSIREIQIQGKQTYLPDAGGASSAKEVINNIRELEPVDIHTKRVALPEVPNDYDIYVKGSDVENVISNDGEITAYNIGERDVDIIVKVVNREDSEDTAEKSFVVHVPDKTTLYPQLYPTVEQPNGKPDVLPALQEWYGYEGAFQLCDQTRILVNDATEVNSMKAAESMQADIADITGIHVEVKHVSDDSDVQKDDIYLETSTEDMYQLGKEGYISIINDAGLRIYSPTYTGILYGSVTALQIISQNPDTKMIPYGVIRDYPKYEIRGIMLDIARTPYRLQMLKDISKYLSWFKMNELHLHINDDFGGNTEGMFRLESEQYPSLNTTTRTGLSAPDYFFNMYGEPRYSKEEYRNLQFLANDFGVDIVTEIDSPGHSKAFNDYAKHNPDNLDWLGADKLTANPRNDQLLDLVGTNAQRARRFIKSLFDEFTSGDEPMFTSDVVSIGADEYWGATPAEKEELRKYVVDLYDVLTANGKTTRMWGQMKAYPGVTPIANDIQLDLWYTGYEDVNARLKEGFKLINIDEGYMYGNPGRNRRDVVNIEYVYENWDPTVFNGLKVVKGEPNLIGGKTALWGDENRQGVIEKDLHERIVRQLAVTSEKTWGAITSKDTYDAYEYKFTKVRDCPNTEIAMHIDSKSSLVASYDMQNVKDGILYDESGNAYNAEVKNGLIVEEDGTAFMKFDGDSKILSPLKTLSYPYTVSFDVKVGEDDKNSEDASLFSGYDGRLQAAGINGSLSINRVMYGQTFDLALTNNKTNITIVGTFEGTKVYVNGKLHKFLYRKDPNNNKYQPDNLFTSFAFPLEVIGKDFQGYLGNIKVYNKALAADLFNESVHKVNVAQNVASAQEIQNINEGGWDVEAKKINVAWKAFDGDGRDLSGNANGITSEIDSRWNGGPHAEAWLSADLGEVRHISSARIQWNAPGFAKAFKIQASLDNENWEDIYITNNNNSDISTITFDGVKDCRYIRMQGVQKNGGNNYSIQEFEVYEHVSKDALQSIVEEAKVIVERNHLQFGDVDPSYQIFFDAYVYAKALSKSPLATIAEIIKAHTDLYEAMQQISNDVNKEALEKVLEEAMRYIEEGIYDIVSEETVLKFANAYAQAKDIFNNALATQMEVNQATKHLQEAITDSVYERDYVLLQAFIVKCDALELSKYADNTQKDIFIAVLQEAKAIQDGEEHAIILTMHEKLQTAKEELILLEDTTLARMILKGALNKATFIKTSESYAILAPAVRDVLDTAYESANLVYEDVQADNAQVLHAWLNLANAMQYVDFTADKGALKVMLDAYKDLDVKLYTEESANVFKEAYAIAEKVYADKHALQKRIDEAYETFDAAVKGLVIAGSVDKTALQNIIAIITSGMEDESVYKQDAYWNVFQSALQHAKEVLTATHATQEEINQAIHMLATAYEDIRLLPNEDQLTILKDFVEKVKNMNRSLFAFEELAIIDATYAQVKTMLEDFDSKQFAAIQIKVGIAAAIMDEKASDEIAKALVTDVKPKVRVDKTTTPTSDSTNLAMTWFILSISGMVLFRSRKKAK